MTQKDMMEKLSGVLFWDIDKSKLDFDVSYSYMIQRVLEYGEWSDWCVIYEYYGLDKIVEACKNMRSLNPISLAYICTISHTKKEDYRCYKLMQSNPTPSWY